MNDILEFGRIILLVAGALSLAIAVRIVAARIGLPTAALLLTVAAVASDLSDWLASLLSFQDVQRVATLALIAILFDGGMSIGLRRFRTAAVPITVLGVLGTFGTAPLVAVAAHYVLGFDWTVALLIGAALAPTDPAVTFSVLAGKEVEGRAGTILEGEWEDVMSVVTACFKALQTDCARIGLNLKVDYRAGPESRLRSKVEKVEQHLVRKLSE